MKKIMLLVLMIFLIGNVSAANWDNKLSYSEEDLKVTISNSFLLLFPTSEIGTAELKSHTSVDEVLQVSVGKDKVVMYYDFDFVDLYENGIGEITFQNMYTGEYFDRDYTLVYWGEKEIDVYGQGNCKTILINGTQINCEKVVIGKTNVYDWLPYNSRDIPKGNIRIGVIVDVKSREKTDVIWKIAGKKISKHAIFTGNGEFANDIGLCADEGDDFNMTLKALTDGILTEIRMGSASGTAVTSQITVYQNSVQLAQGNITYDYDDSIAQSTLTLGLDNYSNVIQSSVDSGKFMIWFYNAWGSNQYKNTSGIEFNGTLFEYAGLQDLAGKHGSADAGPLLTFNETGVATPTITLNSPVNTSNSSSREVTFNGTVFSPSNLVNVSLYIDGIFNETNSSGINDTYYYFTKTFNDGDYNWTYDAWNNENASTTAATRTFTVDTTIPEVTISAPPTTVDFHVLNTNISLNWSANDTNLDSCWYSYEGINTTVTCADNTTGVNITNSVNRTIIFYVNDTFGYINTTTRTWNYNFVETASSFTRDVLETKNYSFEINVSSPQTITSFSAFLNYNKTIYSANSSCSSGDCEISTTIDIPLAATGLDSENKTFFWQLSIFNGTGTSNINTTTQTQNVTAINFNECVAPHDAVNFTTHEESDFSALNTTFNAYFQYYLGTGEVYKEGNSSQTTENIFDFCIDQNETFFVTSSIDLSAPNFDDRHYDLIEKIYTNVTTVQPLYLLNSTLSSVIIIEVKDQGLIPKKDVLVNISRFYLGLGEYVLIESQITDEFGQITAKLIENDAKYKFTFYDLDNTLLKTSERITIVCRSAYCIIPFVIEEITDEFERFENLTTYSYTFSFDNVTNIFAFSWDDQRGESATTRLEVTRYLLNGSSVICNTSSTSILSTLTCSVGSQRASYKAQIFRTVGSERKRISLLNIKVADPASTYGVEGLLWVFLLLFTCIGIGAFNPSIAAGLYGVGFVIMGVLGIISMPIPVFFANTLLVISFIWAVSK